MDLKHGSDLTLMLLLHLMKIDNNLWTKILPEFLY